MLLFCFKHCKTVIMNRFLVVILCIVSGFCRTCGHPTGMPINTRDRMHPYREPKSKPMAYTEESDEPMHGFIEGDPVRTNWLKQGQVELQKALKEGLKMGTAKNIILFIGDGMGLSTVTMARIFKAQQRNLTGNDALLSWESFPHAALLRTYTTTTQVADSAATGTALLSGEKTTQGAVGVNQNVARGNCSAVEGNEVHSILKYAIDEDKWTGIISTTKITHATPAAAYASTAERGWESDADLAADGISGCQDIAVQLIEGDHSKKIKVLLSGGRENFYPNDTRDVEYENVNGRRLDGRDLVQEWIDEKVNYQRVPNQNVHYVYNQSMFDEVDANTAEYLLGLFQPGYMHFEALRPFDLMKEPSLTEMVDKSIDILSRNTENGYFLLVEGGRIDHAHHENRAYHALMDTLAMQDAVERAMNKTNIEDTLIVVTADHSHAFSMAGYPDLSNDILGIAEIADDGKPYTTASYANGPGYVKHRVNESGELEPRRNLSHVDTTTIYYQQDAGIYLESETHGGEDVAVYASGPMSHLFHGVHENNYVAHVMMYAACLGENKDHCEKPWYYPGCPPTTSTSNSIFFSWSYFWLCLIVYLCTVVP